MPAVLLAAGVTVKQFTALLAEGVPPIPSHPLHNEKPQPGGCYALRGRGCWYCVDSFFCSWFAPLPLPRLGVLPDADARDDG
jgi:hypothetical protein